MVKNFLEVIRERKLEMKLSLTKEESAFLGLLIFKAESLRLDNFGTKLYQAKDFVGAKQVKAIQDWIEKRLIKKGENDSLEYISFEGSLKQTYVDRIREILEHYQPLGFSSVFVKYYVPLMAKIKGETLSEENCEE